MTQSDGKIRIDVDLNNTEAKADLGDLEQMCEQTAKHIEQTTATILNNKGKPIKLIDVNSTATLAKAKARLAELRAEMQKVEAETDKMLANATTDNQAANILEMEEEQLRAVKAEYAELERRVRDYEQARVEAQNVAGAGADLKADTETAAFMSKIQTIEQYNAALEKTEQRMREIEQAAQRVANERGVDVNALLQANSEYRKLELRLNALRNAQSDYKKEATNSFAVAEKAADRVGGAIHKGIKRMAKYTLAIFGARSAFFFLKSTMSGFIADNEELQNSINGIKGAIGEMLGPAIERVINLAKIAFAYINAFVKALTGIDFVARYNAKALDKQTKSTKGLTKAQKENQLAGFDEQTKLSDTTSGGSGGGVDGGSAGLALPEISESALEKIQKVADFLKKIKDFVVDNKEEFIALGAAIGTCFIATKLVNFVKSVGSLSGAFAKLTPILKTVFGYFSVALGAWLVVDAIKDMMKNGVTLNNVLELLGGAILVVVGAITLFNSALLANPTTWVVVGIMALIAAIVLCVEYWDEIKLATKKAIDTMVSVVNSLGAKCKEMFISIGTWFKTNAIDPIVTAAKGIWSRISSSFTTLKNNVVSVFKNVGKTIGDFIGGAFKSVINSIFYTIESRINSFIRMINNAIGIINKIPGVNISRVSTVSLPRLAQGGIVNNPGKGVQAVIGEAGAEAVLPLERNTQWMDILADKINGNGGPITIPIYLDGKLIARRVIERQEKMAFATNGGTI